MTMHEPPRDIPFWPDWLHAELGPEHATTWCVAPRLTQRLRDRGYALAITPKRYRELKAMHAAEVREAVRRRLIEAARSAGYRLGATDAAMIVDSILADPAIAIVTEHHDRKGG